MADETGERRTAGRGNMAYETGEWRIAGREKMADKTGEGRIAGSGVHTTHTEPTSHQTVARLELAKSGDTIETRTCDGIGQLQANRKLIRMTQQSYQWHCPKCCQAEGYRAIFLHTIIGPRFNVVTSRCRIF